jgi:head-tail adaptor
MAYPLARDLRDRVKFQRRIATPTALGGTTGAWVDLIASRSVQIVPFRPRRTGGVQDLADRAQGTSPFDMYVRWDSQTSLITTDDRVVDLRLPSRVFKIGFVQDMDGRQVWLTFQLVSGVADG